MAKKATTGVPNRRKRTPEQDKRTYLSRAEREARAQRWLLLGIGGALGVVLIILLVGIVIEGFVRPNQAIAVVNGETVTTRAFEQRVRYTRWQLGQQLTNIASLYGPNYLTDQSSPFYQQFVQLQPGQEYLIGGQVRDQMVDEILIRQEAAERGITADAEAVEARIQEFFGYDPDPEEPAPTIEPTVTPTPIVSPTPSPAPTATPEPEEAEETEEEGTPAPTLTPMPTLTPAPTLTVEEQAERYEEFSTDYFAEAVSVSGMNEAQIREIFELDVLREQVQEEVTGDIPASEEQVDARHILVATEEEAQDILAALEEGESFADLARSASMDTGSGASGGELGWAGRGQYVAEFEDAVFNAEIGAIVGPVPSEFGYHIIQVHAREVRDLTEAQLESKRSTTFTEWLANLKNEVTIEYPNSYIDRTPDDPTIYEMGLVGLVSGS
ncbi:MAG: peptidylprolyl isomerase [Anaerolineae bacterium]|nr:peptidylprolyl isomerase [Anaerolineae bacterium]